MTHALKFPNNSQKFVDIPNNLNYWLPILAGS